MKKQPVLITDAPRSQDDQYRSRQIRYVTMMMLRAACLIGGAVLVSVRPPWLALWLTLCAAGMVFLPWAAVLIANDRSPRTKAERAASAYAAKPQASLPRYTPEDVDYLTIDVDPTESGDRWVPAEPRREKR